VEPAVGELRDVYLYDLDDLEGLSRECEEQRRCELPRVEAIVDEEAREFMGWMTSLEAVPLMAALRAKVEAIREEEVASLLEANPDLTSRQQKALRVATRRIAHRILEDPARGLQALAGNGKAEESLALVRELFRLEGCQLPGAGETPGDGEVEHE
jgi:glutamyl-tRNA reductase